MAMIDNANLTSTLRDAVVIVRLKPGKIGEFEAPGISADLEALAAAHGWRFVLDMQKVGLLGSRGIGMLINFMKQCGANKGKLALASLSPEILEALRVSALTRLFIIKDSVDQAVNAVK